MNQKKSFIIIGILWLAIIVSLISFKEIRNRRSNLEKGVEIPDRLISDLNEKDLRKVPLGKPFKLPIIDIEMTWIPPGENYMGDVHKDGNRKERPVHMVNINEGYWIGKYEIKQGQYKKIMNYNPSFSKGKNNSLNNVSWNGAVTFCKELNKKYSQMLPEEYKFQLPSEAEWEYACRAGTHTTWFFGHSNSNIDNYASTGFRFRTHDEGNKKPNGWGLYELYGNMSEWCEDSWHDNYIGAPKDGSAWITGGSTNERVLRGGSWFSFSSSIRSTFREHSDMEKKESYTGFRLAATKIRKPKKNTDVQTNTNTPAIDWRSIFPTVQNQPKRTPGTKDIFSNFEGDYIIITDTPKNGSSEDVKIEYGGRFKDNPEEALVEFVKAIKPLIGLLSIFSFDQERKITKIEDLSNIKLQKISFLKSFSLPKIDLDMVWINPGSFYTGKITKYQVRPRHNLKIKKGFWLGKYEVTQLQYIRIMGTNTSHFTGDNNPVECVQWKDANEFCKNMNRLYKSILPPGYAFCLPSGMEWEYACQAGEFNDAIMDEEKLMIKAYLAGKENTNDRGKSVGISHPNKFGLYDMKKNVKEWCTNKRTVISSSNKESAEYEICNPDYYFINSGYYNNRSGGKSSANRSTYYPGNTKSANIGFRLAISPIGHVSNQVRKIERERKRRYR